MFHIPVVQPPPAPFDPASPGAIGGTTPAVINATIYQISGHDALKASSANVHALYDTAGRAAISVQTGTAENLYYDRDTHVFRSNLGAASYGAWDANRLRIDNTAGSSSPDTGALTVAGGAGIGGNLNAGGFMNLPRTSSAYKIGGVSVLFGDTSYTYLCDPAAAIKILVGASGDPSTYNRNTKHYFQNVDGSVSYGVWDSTKLAVNNTTPSSSTATGALTVAGGIGCGGNIYAGGGVVVSGSVTAGGQFIATGTLAGNYGVAVTNSDAGASSSAALTLTNNASTSAYIFMGSSVYGSFGGNNSLNLLQVANSPIAFSTNTTLRGIVAGDGGLVWGTPTAGSKGAGNINAVGVYDDNVLLTCFGAQHAARGAVDLAQWDALSPRRHHALAHDFVAMLKDFDPRNPQAYIEKMLRDEALPGMPTASDWKHGEQSLGQLHNRLWLAVELLASAFAGAVQRIGDLEAKQRRMT